MMFIDYILAWARDRGYSAVYGSPEQVNEMLTSVPFADSKDGTAVSNVYMPSDGITVPAGGLCEIGVIVNSDGAFITSRNDLAL